MLLECWLRRNIEKNKLSLSSARAPRPALVWFSNMEFPSWYDDFTQPLCRPRSVRNWHFRLYPAC